MVAHGLRRTKHLLHMLMEELFHRATQPKGHSGATITPATPSSSREWRSADYYHTVGRSHLATDDRSRFSGEKDRSALPCHTKGRGPRIKDNGGAPCDDRLPGLCHSRPIDVSCLKMEAIAPINLHHVVKRFSTPLSCMLNSGQPILC